MTRIIAVGNQKGGVGKTTTTLNLGAALAQAGSSVLLIDLDPQAALTAAFGKDPYTIEPDLRSVLEPNGVPMHEATVRIGRNLYLLPGSLRLPGGPREPEEPLELPPQRLRRLLHRYRLPFDFVLIDTPPTLGGLTRTALVAAGELLIPVQCHFLAMRGVRGILETIGPLRRDFNPDLALTGFVATMFDRQSRVDAEVVEELESVLGKDRVRAVIERDSAIVEASIAGVPVIDLDPDSSSAQAYRSLAEDLRHERF
ncbi:MAG: ParA family protein [Acidobacteriota bacterium]